MTDYEAWAWVLHCGYSYMHGKYIDRLKQRGKFGKLSKKRMNRGWRHVALYLAQKHPTEYLVWKTYRRITE